MKIGFNLLLWTGEVTEEHFGLLDGIKEAGYDGVELPMFAANPSHYEMLNKELKDRELACTAVTVIPDQEHSAISSDPAHRKGAVDFLKGIIDCCQAVNAEVLLGPYHQPLGEFTGEGATEDEKNHGAEVHHEVAEYAQAANVNLAIEYLNRFECYFLNTMEDAVDYVKRVDHPNFGTMYDTFHANIEEKDSVAAIKHGIGSINHVHISENDRGTPGQGQAKIKESIQALKELNYDKWLTIEAFGRSLPDLAAAMLSKNLE